MKDSYVLIGENQKRIDFPFRENQLIRLSGDELRHVVDTYRPAGIKTVLIKHLLKTSK